MSTRTIEILERALELPRAERLVLVDQLICSINAENAANGAPGLAWKEAWETEMEARMERYEKGLTESHDWRESIEAIRKKLHEDRDEVANVV